MKNFLLLISIYLSFQASTALDFFNVKKICSNSAFSHNGQSVDSVIKLTKRITYDLKTFELNENLTSGFEANDWEERVDVSYQNSMHMIGLGFFLGSAPFTRQFSSSFNETFLDKRKDKFKVLRDQLLELKAKYSSKKYESIYEKILGIMDKPMDLIEDLRPIARHLINEKFFSKNDLKKSLEKSSVKMRVKSLPFGQDVDEYFNQKIVTFDYSTYKFNQTATFYYNVFIPATRSRFPIIGKCLESKSLPPFFSK